MRRPMRRPMGDLLKGVILIGLASASACMVVDSGPPVGGPVASPAGYAPPGFFQGHRYAWTNGVGNWEQVRQIARQMGGDLVAINSAEENEFVLRTFGDGPYFIGLVQYPNAPEPGDGWHWVGDVPITFTNWMDGQPDNYTGRDNYGVFYPGWRGRWGDVPVEGWPATSNYRGVVEFGPPGAPVAQAAPAYPQPPYAQPAPPPTYAPPAPQPPPAAAEPMTITTARHKYRRVEQPGVTWERARKEAAAMKLDGMPGHLAIIETETYGEEILALHDAVFGPGVPRDHGYWIGASREVAPTEGHQGWLWIDGTEVPSSITHIWRVDFAEGNVREGACVWMDAQKTSGGDYATSNPGGFVVGFIVEFEPAPPKK